MDVERKAQAARRLRNNEDFCLFIEEFRADCIAVFTDSSAEQQDRREEAHAHLRAITKLLGTLDAAEAAQTLDERKKNGRRAENG